MPENSVFVRVKITVNGTAYKADCLLPLEDEDRIPGVLGTAIKEACRAATCEPTLALASALVSLLHGIPKDLAFLKQATALQEAAIAYVNTYYGGEKEQPCRV